MSSGTIGKQRAEILRLIQRIHRDAGSNGKRDLADPLPADRPTRSSMPARRHAATAPAGRSSSPVHPRGQRVRTALTDIQARQDRLEELLGDGRLADSLAAFEQRIGRLEQLVERDPAARSRAPGGESAAFPPGCALTGRLQDGLLSDILQLISANSLTGEFVVTSDGVEINLYFDEGSICHAVGPGLVGEEAFFTIMTLEAGSYYFRPTDSLPAERTVESKTQFLILEALRLADERNAGSDAQ